MKVRKTPTPAAARSQPSTLERGSHDFDELCEAVNNERAAANIFIRGIQPGRCPPGWDERLPIASQLMALPEDERELAIWWSGVSPSTPEMIDAFLSLAHRPGLGWTIAASVDSGFPPNPQFHKGEGRLDELVWPNGYPAGLQKKPAPKSPPHRHYPKRREQEADRRALEAECGLFKLLECGCLEECVGPEIHAAEASAEEDKHREFASQCSSIAHALARATLSGDE